MGSYTMKKRALNRIRKRLKKECFRKNELQVLNNIDVIDPLYVKSFFRKMPTLIFEMKKIKKDFNLSSFLNEMNKNIFDNSIYRKSLYIEKQGMLSEYYVYLVLSVLKQNGIINNFFITSRYSADDIDRIDAQIILVDRQKYFFLPLQVKSSKKYQKEHIEKNNKDNAKIPSVVSTIKLSILMKRILTIISFAYKGQIIHT